MSIVQIVDHIYNTLHSRQTSFPWKKYSPADGDEFIQK